MLEDPQRGSAWTHALLGIAAEEIHVCGNPRAGYQLRQILGSVGEIVSLFIFVFGLT
jgi:ATP-dependent RNA helicase SUPV3L1/SUV3